jgi:hypothetical protein
MQDAFEYSEYILIYVDDVLFNQCIKEWFILNDLRRVWSINSVQSIKEAIRNVELEVIKSGHVLKEISLD